MNGVKIITESDASKEEVEDYSFRDVIRFAKSGNRIQRRNLNNTSGNDNPTFYLYSRDDITNYLGNPYSYEDNLRNASIYMYGASTHYRRIIQHFAGLTDLAHIITPYKLDTTKPSSYKKIGANYQKTIDLIANMDIRNQFKKIVTVCLREDTFYGTIWESKDNVTVQQLPSKYCSIETIQDNVPNVSFNFSYFSRKEALLNFYPEEFKKKYNIYKKDNSLKWQELDAPNSFAVKCNSDILDYATPPLVGVFREIYDIEDYKQLKLAKSELENYALLVMQLDMTDDGKFKIKLPQAKDFWNNLDSVLPEQIGSILTPMKLEKIGFDRSGTADSDKIAEAEQHLWSAAGVSSMIFNNEKATADALLVSIKSDQAITFGIVKSIETAINRYIHSKSFAKQFKVTFLDVSPYNRKEFSELCKNGMTLGAPCISMYCASLGIDQTEMYAMSTLEQDILKLPEKFRPLDTSYTQSGKTPKEPKSVDKNDEGDNE